MTYLTTAPERCDLDSTRTLWHETDKNVTRRVVDIAPNDEWRQLGQYIAAGHISERVPKWVEAAA